MAQRFCKLAEGRSVIAELLPAIPKYVSTSKRFWYNHAIRLIEAVNTQHSYECIHRLFDDPLLVHIYERSRTASGIELPFRTVTGVRYSSGKTSQPISMRTVSQHAQQGQKPSSSLKQGNDSEQQYTEVIRYKLIWPLIHTVEEHGLRFSRLAFMLLSPPLALVATVLSTFGLKIFNGIGHTELRRARTLIEEKFLHDYQMYPGKIEQLKLVFHATAVSANEELAGSAARDRDVGRSHAKWRRVGRFPVTRAKGQHGLAFDNRLTKRSQLAVLELCWLTPKAEKLLSEELEDE